MKTASTEGSTSKTVSVTTNPDNNQPQQPLVSVPVAVVALLPNKCYQVQVWQGHYDLPNRKWLNSPEGPRATSGDLPNQELAHIFGEHMARDLGCVDLIHETPN